MAANINETASANLAECIESWCETPVLAKSAQVDQVVAVLPLYPTDQIEEHGRIAASILEKHPAAAIEILMQLSASPQPQSRALATAAIARLAIYAPSIWVNLIKHLLTDTDWEVRRYAARVFDSTSKFDGAAEYHLEYLLGVVGEWTRDRDYLVRYAATQSFLGYVRRHPEFGERLLGLLDPLYDDPAEYVRDGAAAAMRAVGKDRPELVFSFIELKLDQLKDCERATYRTALDHPYADKRPEWKAKLLAALTDTQSTT